MSSLFTTVAIAQNPLAIPPSLSGTNFNLTLQEGTTDFYLGVTTNTMGANGSLLGPTLILQKDDFISISVDNQLQDTTTIHWHGMHVAPENDGGPHSIIPPNSIWNPQFTVMDQAGINWYHPHLHMQTNKHVSKGIAGLIIVKDADEAALTLPRDYGVDDFPIVIQTKGFDSNGQIEWMSELDTSLMVNGTIDPYLDAPAQVVRLRILNGSSQRVYKLGFTNDMAFELIGTDGGLLEAPVNLTRYQMAPGQRADILVDLSSLQGQSLQLLSYSSEIGNAIYGSSQPGIMPQHTNNLVGYTSNPLNGTNFVILDLNIGAPTAAPVTTIPSTLITQNILAEGTEDITRSLTFSTQQNIVGPFLINGSTFDMGTINETIPLGNREIWSLTNQTPIAHPFHIHDVQFRILDINGNPPPPELQGLNDVVLVPGGMGNIRFITEFLDFANDTIPYMYHCHMLTHEDQGMMGQFIVTDPNNDLSENNGLERKILVYPNPSAGDFHVDISNLGDEVTEISIISSAGIKIKTVESPSHITEFNVNLDTGIYFINIQLSNGQILTKKVVIE
ncbi:MAG: multicopper oxidase domain-containing protein [Crocinitomicaceae bacterium]|nr:multicopper oxidase domain-containing protein [Crocinitomicaceae bacterium]